MASSSREGHSGSPMTANAPAVPMDAKLMVATGRGDCQQLKDVVNKEDAAMMASSNTRASAAAASPPVAMHPLLLASASSGDWKGVNFLLNKEEAHADSSVQPSQEFLKSLEACTSGNGRLRTPGASNDIEEGANMPLLSAESLLEGVTIEGNTALHVVATHGDGHNFLKCVDTICAKGKHLLFKPNNNGDTPLHCAARAGNHEMVDKLIGLAIGPSRREESVDKIENDLLRSENLSTETVLNDDVHIGDNLTVIDNIDRSEDSVNREVKYLRMENDCKETALHEAIRIGHSPIVKKLLTYDLELARFPKEGTSPLYLAILLEQFDIAQKLHEMSRHNILSYSGPTGQNALHVAVLRSRETTERLLTWKNDLSAERDKHGSTPLHFAVSVESSLHNRYSSKTIISKVLEASPSSAFQPDNEKSLPIHVAASAGVRSAIALLTEKWPGCASFRDSAGRTFLHIAVQKQRNDIVRFACRKVVLSSVLNMQDNEGNTALHLAVQLGNLSLVCSLLGNKRVLLNLTNKIGQTPLDVARGKIPTGIFYGWNLEETIHHALVRSGAKHGTIRWDQLQEKHIPIKTAEENSNESQILSDSTQTLAIGSVLIATVTFGATFALPGGYRADDHINGGTPTLAGRYTFDAFIMATTLAFICSSIATLDLMYSGISMVNLPVRRKHFAVSIFFLTSSATSLVAAFALGVFMVLAPVDVKTGIAICVLSPFTMLYRNKGRLQKLYALAGPLYIRMGLWALLSLTKDILSGVLMECWTLILIFGWAGYTTYCRHHR